MNKKVKPTLYIALGTACKAILQQNFRLLEERNPLLLNIVNDIIIEDDGKCSSIIEDTHHLTIDVEEDITQKGVFAKNYKELLEKEEQTYDLIRRAMTSINQYDKRRPLIEQEYEIGEPQIVICSTFHEAVASSLLIPFLKQIYAIKQEMNYLYSEVTGLFILPDLFHSISGEGAFKIVSDYEKGEKIKPMLKDAQLADRGDIAYKPIASIGRKPFPFLKGEGDSHKIEIGDIDQGAVGNCYFLALLGGLAHTQPDYIQQMVIDNLDNTYTIRFHLEDGSEKHVTIDNKFWLDNEGRPIYSKVADFNEYQIETWVMLVEKAWAKWHKGYQHIEGGNTLKDDYAMALTGNRREFVEITNSTNEQQFTEKLFKHLYEKKMPVCFTSKAAKEEGDDPMVVENHAYILKDVSFQDGEVNLYNPYGRNHLYNCDFNYIKHHFVAVTYYEIEPYDKAISTRYKRIRDLEYARTIAAVNELDIELDKADSKGISLVNYPFFVGSQNSKNITLGSFSEMLISLSEFSLMLINEGFATNNLAIQIGEDSQGKSARYSSLGYSSLIYPEEEFVNGVYAIGKKEILHDLQHAFRNDKFAANSLSAEVKSFMANNQFNQYQERMRLEIDGGKPIFEPFQFSGERSEKADIKSFVASLDKQGEEYEAKVFNKSIVQKIEQRQKALTTKLSQDISQKIESEIGKGDKNINFAHGFASTLLREDCNAITGEILDDVKDLRSIEYDILDFYRSRTNLPQLMKESDEQYKLIRNKERQLSKLKIETQRLSEKISSEKAKIEGGQKETSIDVANLEVELKSKQDEANKVEIEVQNLTADYQDKKSKVEGLKRELESAEYRKQLRESDLSEQQTNLDNHLQTIVTAEQERRTILDRYEKLKAEKDKLLKKLLIFFPLLIFGIPALIAIFLEIFEKDMMDEMFKLAESSRVGMYLQLFLIVAVIYGIFAFLRYRKKIGKRMKEAEQELNDVNKRKVNLLNEHIALRGKTYELRFDHLLNSSAYDGVAGLIRQTDQYNDQLAGFKKTVIEEYAEACDTSDHLAFENNLFQSSILTKKDIDRLRDPQNLGKFLREKEGRTLPAYYNEYIKSSSLEKMDTDIQEYLVDLYRPLVRKSVGDFIYRDQAIINEVNPNTRFKLLTDASEVYINLKDYGTGDHTEETANLYVNNMEDPDSDETYKLITNAGLNAKSKQSTGDKNTISVFRAKKGFPAFQMTIMDECRGILDSVTGPSSDQPYDKADFYVKPAYAKDDIFPTTLTLGNTTDEVRIAFAKGRALGIVEDGKDCFCFDGEDLGDTIEECIKHLKSLKGEDTKEKLIKVVNSTLADMDTPQEQKLVIQKVKHFMQTHPTLDAVERKILEDLMRSFV